RQFFGCAGYLGEPHLGSPPLAVNRRGLDGAERQSAAQDHDRSSRLQWIGHDQPIAESTHSQQSHGRDKAKKNQRKQRPPDPREPPCPDLSIRVRKRGLDLQNFLPRCSHFPRRVTQNDSTKSFKSSPKFCFSI